MITVEAHRTCYTCITNISVIYLDLQFFIICHLTRGRQYYGFLKLWFLSAVLAVLLQKTSGLP